MRRAPDATSRRNAVVAVVSPPVLGRTAVSVGGVAIIVGVVIGAASVVVVVDAVVLVATSVVVVVVESAVVVVASVVLGGNCVANPKRMMSEPPFTVMIVDASVGSTGPPAKRPVR